MTHVIHEAALHGKSSAKEEARGAVAFDVFTSAGVAALVVACLIWTAGDRPLPALPWAAAFLFVVVQQDVSRLRIPNRVTFPSLFAALGLAAVLGGGAGLLASLAGAGAALGITFLPFAFRWLGAGDVKAGMVLGALWGAGPFLSAFWWMIVAGGVLAIGFVAAQGEFVDMLRRWFQSAWLTLRTGKVTYFGPPAQSAARAGLPFGVAMGLGAAAFQMWGTPWS